MWKVNFHPNRVFWRLSLVSGTSRDLTAWLNCIFCHVVLQLSWPFSSLHASHVCHFGDLLVTSQLWDPVVRLLWLHTSWVFFTLFHTQSLHKSHLNTGYLIAKIQANLARNKSNTWLNKFNFTNSTQTFRVGKNKSHCWLKMNGGLDGSGLDGWQSKSVQW